MGSIEEKAKWPGWETVGLLGRGGFGAVFEIQRDVLGKTEYAALKVLQIPQNENDVEELYANGYNDESVTAYYKNYLKDIVREYQLMLDMKGHTNVVYCDDFHYEPNESGIGWTIYIKMELLTPLLKSLGTEIEEETVIRLGRDIANALVLCRSRNILHRDIKPQNIFISRDGDYKLGDFGIAKTVERTAGGTKIGTYNYMAPEVYNNKPYGHQADIYSLGLVMYWMLNERRMPFVALPPAAPTASMQEEARNRRFRGEAIPEPRHGSAELQRIVLKACAAEPKERYQRAEDLRDDLKRLLNGGQGEVTVETDEDDADVTVLDESAVLTPRDEPAPEEEEKKEKERTSGRDEEKKSEEKKEEEKKEKTRRKSPWGIIAAALVVLGLAAGAWYMRDRLPIRAPEPSPEATVETEPTPEPAPLPTPELTPEPAPEPTPEPTPVVLSGLQPGDRITIGNYEQDADVGNGPEPIEWRVLAVYGQEALVLSEQVLEWQIFSENPSFSEWSVSPLRQWLNDDFYDTAFNTAEQEVILERENYWSGDARDRVFLLSGEEAGNSGFFEGDADRLSDSSRQVIATASIGANTLTTDVSQITREWWLRDYHVSGWQRSVSDSGDARWMGSASLFKGVRPAMLVRVSVDDDEARHLYYQYENGSLRADLSVDEESQLPISIWSYNEDGSVNCYLRFEYDENRLTAVHRFNAKDQEIGSHSYKYDDATLTKDVCLLTGGGTTEYSLAPFSERQKTYRTLDRRTGDSDFSTEDGYTARFNAGCVVLEMYFDRLGNMLSSAVEYADDEIRVEYDIGWTQTRVFRTMWSEYGHVRNEYCQGELVSVLKLDEGLDEDRGQLYEKTDGVLTLPSILHRTYISDEGNVTTFSYDSLNNMRPINLIHYETDGSISFYYLFEYNEEGKLITVSRYDGQNRRIQYREYEYGEDGLVSKQIVHHHGNTFTLEPTSSKILGASNRYSFMDYENNSYGSSSGKPISLGVTLCDIHSNGWAEYAISGTGEITRTVLNQPRKKSYTTPGLREFWILPDLSTRLCYINYEIDGVLYNCSFYEEGAELSDANN